MKDVVKAWATNGTILGIVTVAEAEAVLKVILLGLTCIYTGVKIFKSITTKKKETESDES
jgi:hypothetical protein